MIATALAHRRNLKSVDIGRVISLRRPIGLKLRSYTYRSKGEQDSRVRSVALDRHLL